MILADTSVLVDHLRGDDAATGALAAARRLGERVAASTVTRVEILGGMRASEKRATLVLVGALQWVPLDSPIADQAGAYARRYRRSHPGVDVADYVIAATAETVGAQLWTQNLRHFPMFPSLTAPY